MSVNETNQLKAEIGELKEMVNQIKLVSNYNQPQSVLGYNQQHHEKQYGYNLSKPTNIYSGGYNQTKAETNQTSNKETQECFFL